MVPAKKKPNTLQMLNAAIASERLSLEELNAFSDMRERFYSGAQRRFSTAQTVWIERVYRNLELDADEAPENLVSNGLVEPGERGRVYAFEQMPRPLKPPGK